MWATGRVFLRTPVCAGQQVSGGGRGGRRVGRGSGGGDSSGGLGAGAGQEPGIALVHRPLCGLAGLYFLSSEAGATATCPPVHVRFP